LGPSKGEDGGDGKKSIYEGGEGKVLKVKKVKNKIK
jgi:hypothetical protein